jgi:hypothetical protein
MHILLIRVLATHIRGSSRNTTTYASRSIDEEYNLSQIITSVSRTFLYNPLMLFYAISFRLRRDKENKKSLGSSVASDIRWNETTKKTMMLRSISEEEEEKGAT